MIHIQSTFRSASLLLVLIILLSVPAHILNAQTMSAVDQESINLLTAMYLQMQKDCPSKLQEAKAQEQKFGNCAIPKVKNCIATTGYKNRNACASRATASCRSIIAEFADICSRAPLPTKTATKPTSSDQKTKPKLQACLISQHLRRDPETKQCVCTQLYRKNDKTNECIFSGAKGVPLDNESFHQFQELVEKLQENQGGVFEGKTNDGKMVRLGVFRLPSGAYVFTANGLHFFSDAKDAASPGLWKRTTTSFGNLTRRIGMFFGIGKYTGRDTKGSSNQQAQDDGQMRLDAATAALKDLQDNDDNDAIKKGEAQRELLESNYKRMKNVLGNKWQELAIDQFKETTGLDPMLIKKILTGDIVGIATDQLNDALGKIFSPTFAAEAVTTMAKEIRNANFANAAHLYIQERQAGKNPATIFALLSNGSLPELDFVTSIKGVGLLYLRGQMFIAYEDAYQRYLLTVKLKNQ